jgi:acylphosphatase
LKIRAHVFVSGRVQRVFFRYETRREAKKNGVTGWVRNMPDGRLEATFEGEESDVKALVDFCRKGPPAAKVTNVDIRWEAYTGEFRNFETR